MGGTITGEHGVGIEKINQMCVQFSPKELARMHEIKHAFDEHGLLESRQGGTDAAPLCRIWKMRVGKGKPMPLRTCRGFDSIGRAGIARPVNRKGGHTLT